MYVLLHIYSITTIVVISFSFENHAKLIRKVSDYSHLFICRSCTFLSSRLIRFNNIIIYYLCLNNACLFDYIPTLMLKIY